MYSFTFYTRTHSCTLTHTKSYHITVEHSKSNQDKLRWCRKIEFLIIIRNCWCTAWEHFNIKTSNYTLELVRYTTPGPTILFFQQLTQLCSASPWNKHLSKTTRKTSFIFIFCVLTCVSSRLTSEMHCRSRESKSMAFPPCGLWHGWWVCALWWHGRGSTGKWKASLRYVCEYALSCKLSYTWNRHSRGSDAPCQPLASC